MIPSLFRKYPTAVELAAADKEELSQMIAVLGFRNRRADNLIRMSKQYSEGNWKHVKDLPGIGEYAAAAWEMFVAGNLPASEPNDHALRYYWRWRKKHGI